MRLVSVKGICDSVARMKTYFPTVDTFISSISYEERFARGSQILDENNITINTKVLFYYNQVLQTYNRVAAEAQFDTAFTIRQNDKKLYLDMYDEMEGLLTFKAYLEENLNQFEDKNIIVDMSVMVKPYFLLLLKHLSMVRTNRIGFIYTEPESYDTFDTFTKGTIATQDIPGFSGKKTLSKKDALALMLGFEGNRAMSVSNEINPELTIPINGFPSFQPKFKDDSIVQNKELLKDDVIFKNLKFAPAYDPFETQHTLNEIYEEYSNDFNISIAPLGSKPMALGAGFFALEHDDCRVIYPYPQKYFPKSSRGWRQSWLYVAQIEGTLSCTPVNCP